MAKRKHFLFEEIEEYLRNKVYPSNIAAKDYGSKSNFRRTTRKYSFKDGHLFYKKCIFIKDRNCQMEIIRDIHSGIGNSEHSKAMALLEAKIQRMKKLHKDFLGAIFQMILVTLLRSVTCVKNRVTLSPQRLI